MFYQQTISRKGEISGIGLHTGIMITLFIIPLKEDSGILFKRSDLFTKNIITAKFFNVSNTNLCTEISNKHGAKISTIEHIMAALWAMKIDNVLIEVSGPEVPIVDGSSKAFIELIKESGIKVQSKKRNYLKIIKTVKVNIKDKELTIKSSENFKISFNINFKNKAVGYQQYSLCNPMQFEKEISHARTFGFLNDIAYLRNNGMAKGASLKNSIGIDKNGIINTEGLRYTNEFVRHKILDCIGDLFLSGYQIIGNIEGSKAGHCLNNRILKEIFNNPDTYSII